MAAQRICSVDGCGKRYYCRGFCARHYDRFRRNGFTHTRIAEKGSGAAFIDAAMALETDDCIDWPYGLSDDGYGIIGNGKAHRIVCARAHGAPPFPRAHACHSCNRPICINKRHLRWGGAKENMADCIASGGLSVGTQRREAKLTDEIVRAIRNSTESDAAMARRYGVSAPTIRQARIRKRWRHVV